MNTPFQWWFLSFLGEERFVIVMAQNVVDALRMAQRHGLAPEMTEDSQGVHGIPLHDFTWPDPTHCYKLMGRELAQAALTLIDRQFSERDVPRRWDRSGPWRRLTWPGLNSYEPLP